MHRFWGFLLSDNQNLHQLFQRKEAHSLVEEFMLLANMSVARRINEYFPDFALLRRHPPPKANIMREMVIHISISKRWLFSYYRLNYPAKSVSQSMWARQLHSLLRSRNVSIIQTRICRLQRCSLNCWCVRCSWRHTSVLVWSTMKTIIDTTHSMCHSKFTVFRAIEIKRFYSSISFDLLMRTIFSFYNWLFCVFSYTHFTSPIRHYADIIVIVYSPHHSVWIDSFIVVF